MIIVRNTLYFYLKVSKRVYFKCSHKKNKENGIYVDLIVMLISLIEMIISQCVCVCFDIYIYTSSCISLIYTFLSIIFQ